jgi:DNA-binding response OmpR family regulator
MSRTKRSEDARLSAETSAANRSLNVLVVEDDKLIAMLLEEMLTDLGHKSVEIVHTVKEATAVARRTRVDLALLDANLGGFSSFPVADILAKRKIPLIFLTGYGKAGIEHRYAGTPVLCKPFDTAQLAELISKMQSEASSTRTDASSKTAGPVAIA